MRYQYRLFALALLFSMGLSGNNYVQAQFGFNPYAGQFNPYAGIASPLGIYNPNLYTPYTFNYANVINYPYVNPVTGFAYNINSTFLYSGYSPNIPGVTTGYYRAGISPYNPAPYYRQGESAYDSPGNNPIVQQRLRVLRQARQLPAQPSKKAIAAAARPDVNGEVGKPGPIDKAPIEAELLNPSDDALLSGNALNELAETIRTLRADRPTTSGPFVPASVLKDIRFQGSDAAMVLTLFSKPGTEMAKPFQKPENIAPRVALKEPLAAFKSAYATGKGIPLNVSEKITKAITQARAVLDQTKSSDVDRMRKYIDQLEKVVEFAQTPEGRGAYHAKWFSVGASVDNVITNMEQYKIEFAPGDKSDRPEYQLLYRAMLNYYAKLKQAGNI